MAKGIVDKSGLLEQLIGELQKNGSARLVHLGLFRVKVLKGRKRYDFKKRKVIAMKPYKVIIFTPARGIREMLGGDKMAASE